MDTTVWGPKLWFVMHTVSLNYPDSPDFNQKQSHKLFFNNLKDIIPCPHCQAHYSEYLKLNPINRHLETKMDLVKWVWNLHNDVSARLGKPTWSLDKLLAHYNDVYTKKSKCGKKILYLTIFFALLFLAYYLFKNYTWARK